ncbi:6845_t:CDS:2, partial [Cetraspora pellucida]
MDNISNNYHSMDDSSDSELSGTDFEGSGEIENHNNPLELKVKLIFGSFKKFKAWIECFAKKEGFMAKYLLETLYPNKKAWGIPWIHNVFTAGVQSTQRIELINKQIHDKVDQVTSLCDLLVNINDYIKSEKQFKKFEIEHNALPTIGLLILNTRLFKEQLQMNQSVCFDVNQIQDWQQLVKNDNEEINDRFREHNEDIQQAFFKLLIKNIVHEDVLE